ncbi:amidohydrolase [Vallicoccus soli]|uniref:amidohydrolase n=1 Tax=Vallicoccus soli TaxID=2339232 RepID=UPI001C4986DA|nr:amidohydrolase [Vallicoccus soli]
MLDPVSLDALVAPRLEGLVALRRDLHAHPELGRREVRTTRVVAEHLAAAGVPSRVLRGGTGLVADVGPPGAPALGLRADLDALPVQDQKTAPYRSTVDGVCHACGHDVHTAVLAGAGTVLAGLAAQGRLAAPVRLFFQPAEELVPGGALDLLEEGVVDDVPEVLALHCDPRLPAGQLGVRTGAITGASDQFSVRLAGPGGHTARPHLTGDLVHALATVVTQLPAVLSRRVDPRAGLSVVWGHVAAGAAPNAIPEHGLARGTLRTLDVGVWEDAPELVAEVVHALVAPYGVRAEVEHVRGVPPVVNAPESVRLLERAGRAALGPEAVVETEQSLGGEDFAWFLRRTAGAMARLGVARPDATGSHDLHQGTFDVDERALGAGTRLLVAAALLRAGAGTPAGPR